jgi:5-deoxy-D-glucuronate isomerase
MAESSSTAAVEKPAAMADPLDLVRRHDAVEGHANVLSAQNARLKDLAVGRLRLDVKSSAYVSDTADRETILHILVGTCDVEVKTEGQSRVFKDLGEREDVFSGLPTSLVLGPATHYKVTPKSRTLDIAVASLPLPGNNPAAPAVIRPQDVRVHKIGEAHYERLVREVVGGDGPALRMRLGETVNPAGLWSSWPHHEFDANPKLAPQFEEVFLYFTKPRDGWGLQKRNGLFHDLTPVDDVLIVRNGDAAVVPLGDHPVVAGVENQLIYIWFYVSPIPKVYAKWAEDVGGYA